MRGRHARRSPAAEITRKTMPVALAAAGALLSQQAAHQPPARPLTLATTTDPEIHLTSDVAKAPSASSYTVRPGDSLWSIAQHFYGSGWDWRRIWDANPQITNPNLIDVGQVLTIPSAGSSPQSSAPHTDTASAAVQASPQSAVQGSPEAVLQHVAASFGWTSSNGEWQALQQLEGMEDAGYSTTIANPSSGALGLAQALGHATPGSAGTLGDEYGANYGLTTAQAVGANSGNAYDQALWECTYIQQTYGTPSAAVQFHLANNYY